MDPDVYRKARKSAAQLGQPFKQVVNSALRLGLEELLKPLPARPYKTKARPMGLNEGFSYDNVSELLARAEGEEHS